MDIVFQLDAGSRIGKFLQREEWRWPRAGVRGRQGGRDKEQEVIVNEYRVSV